MVSHILRKDWKLLCPWLEHMLQHAGILAVGGAAALVFVQLPWSVAFAFQQWVDGRTAEGAGIVMTLMNMVAAYKTAANGGEFRSVEMGVCGTKAEQDGISLRCKQIGRTQFCYSATVYEADGRHNPVVTKCSADYRAYVPGFTNALGFLGVDLPLRDRGGLAQYPVGATDLDRSCLLIKV